MIRQVFLGLCLGMSLAQADDAQMSEFLARPQVQRFIDEVSARHQVDRAGLAAVLAKAKPQAQVLEAISRPAEAKPWHIYRQIFITPERIAAGVAFWDAHDARLHELAERFGVAPEIIVAILGVETFYGRHMGRFSILDALATLGFDYPPRAVFFQGELEQFLLLIKEEELDAETVQGSYAGAMGLGQFIPSSYRTYAVDQDGDGRRNLWDSADALASVANYLSRHGWQADAPVAVPVEVNTADPPPHGELKPNLTLAALAQAGVKVAMPLDPETKATLLAFDALKGKEYWLGFENFYVITRYNRSPLYALAVYQLSQAIKEARAQHLAQHPEGLDG